MFVFLLDECRNIYIGGSCVFPQFVVEFALETQQYDRSSFKLLRPQEFKNCETCKNNGDILFLN